MTTRPRIELTDDLIERMVSDRARSRVPSDLVEAILSEAVVTLQRRARGYPRLWPTAPRARWVSVGIVLALLALGAAIVGASMLRPRTTIGGGGLLVIAQVDHSVGRPRTMHVFGLDEATGDQTRVADWTIRSLEGTSARPIRALARLFWGQTGWVKWSPDRSHAVLFDLASSVQGIVDAASGELTPASWLPGDFAAARGTDQVAWAPTSDRLATVVPDDAGADNVLISDVRGRTTVRLALPAGAETAQPEWAPDGSAILLSGCGPCGTQEDGRRAAHLYIVPVDGSPVRILLDGPTSVADAAWSPDGSRIAYATDPGIATLDGIATIDVQTGRVNVLTHGWDVHPTWAPDGRRIAFARRPDSSLPAGINVVDSDGAHLAQLSDGPEDEYPAWSPDGTLIMFERFAAPLPSVWVVAPDGDGPRLIVEDATADW